MMAAILLIIFSFKPAHYGPNSVYVEHDSVITTRPQPSRHNGKDLLACPASAVFVLVALSSRLARFRYTPLIPPSIVVRSGSSHGSSISCANLAGDLSGGFFFVARERRHPRGRIRTLRVMMGSRFRCAGFACSAPVSFIWFLRAIFSPGWGRRHHGIARRHSALRHPRQEGVVGGVQSLPRRPRSVSALAACTPSLLQQGLRQTGYCLACCRPCLPWSFGRPACRCAGHERSSDKPIPARGGGLTGVRVIERKSMASCLRLCLTLVFLATSICQRGLARVYQLDRVLKVPLTASAANHRSAG